MPLLSIIVPVYKVEQYLPRCIESILAQSFQDFELLLIDDGSPDQSGLICDKYAETDSRVRVFHKTNGGVSSARNMGLDNAIGKYIGFVDSDDYILPDMYLTLIEMIRHSGNTGIASINHVRSPWDEKDILRTISPSEMIDLLFTKRNFFIWDKLFIADLIGDLRFDVNIKLGEDLVFITEYLKAVRQGVYRNAKLYYYYPAPESATHQLKSETHIENLPNTLYTVYQNVLIISRQKKDVALNWIINDIILWLNHAKANKKLHKEINRNAWSLRKQGLTCKCTDWKVRVLFFLGLY